MKNFNFKFYGNIFFGINERKVLKKILDDNQFKNICIVIDHALIDIEIFKILIDSLDCKKIIIKCDISEPTYQKLEEKERTSWVKK